MGRYGVGYAAGDPVSRSQVERNGERNEISIDQAVLTAGFGAETAETVPLGAVVAGATRRAVSPIAALRPSRSGDHPAVAAPRWLPSDHSCCPGGTLRKAPVTTPDFNQHHPPPPPDPVPPPAAPGGYDPPYPPPGGDEPGYAPTGDLQPGPPPPGFPPIGGPQPAWGAPPGTTSGRAATPLLGILGVLGVAVVGALVWALILIYAHSTFSLIAVLIGSLVGAQLSNALGRNAVSGVIAAVLTVVACLAGEVAGVWGYGLRKGLPFAEVRQLAPIGSVLHHLGGFVVLFLIIGGGHRVHGRDRTPELLQRRQAPPPDLLERLRRRGIRRHRQLLSATVHPSAAT